MSVFVVSLAFPRVVVVFRMNPSQSGELPGRRIAGMLVVREKCEQIDNLAGFQLVLKLLRHERHVADLEGVDLRRGESFRSCRLNFQHNAAGVSSTTNPVSTRPSLVTTMTAR